MSDLILMIRENPESDYKYLFERIGWGIGYKAFRTLKGFKNFIKICNLKLKFKKKYYNEKYGNIKVYNVLGNIEERFFWSLSEVPKEAVKYKDLCNGHYVDCYYLQTEEGTIIYKPNPNAKNVYKPLSLEDHLELSKKIG